MGEARRRREKLDDTLIALTRKMADEGKLIALGFAAFDQLVIPKGASDVQRREMLLAYMAGAQHLWGSIMTFLDGDGEPTDNDFRRMDLVEQELEEWAAILSMRADPPQGSG